MQRNYWDDRRRDERFEADDDRGWRQRRDDDRRGDYRDDDDRSGRQRGSFGHDENFRRQGGQVRQDHYRDEWFARDAGQGRGRGGDMPGWGAAYNEAFGGSGCDDREGGRRRVQGGQGGSRQDDWASQRQTGQQTTGAHRGRGPKGYTRSDERIKEDVSDRLSDDDMVDASNIEVSVSKCEVTLGGTVDSREAKRRAEDCAENVSGVQHVQNNLRVKSWQDSESDSSGSSGKTGRN